MLTPKYSANHKIWSEEALENAVYSHIYNFCIYGMEWWWVHVAWTQSEVKQSWHFSGVETFLSDLRRIYLTKEVVNRLSYWYHKWPE